ncbi:MAG TPA: Na+/H+ antiporter [Acidimicrobiales bacterium]|nr:Na+/H+ antiporter [Acidimicrobiales bacterium]
MTIAEILGLLIGIVVIATVADRLRIAYPILLVIAGLVVAILPFAHRVQLEPDLVLLVFLPPLIYDASLDTSARELRTHWRPILLLAVGLVLATMTLVAVVFHLLVPQSGWGEAFALGAIVSPPDSVAATQIAGKLGLPRRLVTILGGEGLMNDATALTAYQLAVASLATTLTVADVAARFLFAVAAGVGIGLAIGWAGTRLLRVTETPVIENTMLLILPFAAYLPADKVGASGVLAVVGCGLYFGRYGSRSLTAGARLQQREIWELIVFLLTGLSFLLVGLELRPVLEALTARSSESLVVESLSVVGAVVVLRLAWMFGVRLLPGGRHLLSTGQRTPSTWRETTVVGWAGMRGAISLAAALALPANFAERDLVLFLTFAVIVATLVGQGLTLPPLIRRLGLVSQGEQDLVLAAEARRRLIVLALTRMDALAADSGTPDDVTERLRTGYEALLDHVDRRLDTLGDHGDDGGAGAPRPDGGTGEVTRPTLDAEVVLRRKVIAVERDELDRLVARRKVGRHVADEVRTALDVDETTMRP